MNLNKEIKAEYNDLSRSDLEARVARLARICQNLEIPVLVMVDGFESAGKGYVINYLSQDLIPKYFDVDVFEKNEEYDNRFPFEKRFFENVPRKGHIKIFDRSLYYKLFDDLSLKEKELDKKIKSMEKMEKMLYDDQTIIIKFFLNVSKDEQKKRIEKLKDSNENSFYLKRNDEEQNKNYKDYQKHFENIIEKTDFYFSPWTIIDSDDLKEASKEALYQMLEALTIGLERVSTQRLDNENTERSYQSNNKIIEKLDLTKKISEEEYKEKKDKLEKEVRDMMFSTLR